MLHTLTHLLNCREATRLLSRREDRSLTAGEAVKLRLHLLACVACTRFSRQLRLMRAALTRYRA